MSGKSPKKRTVKRSEPQSFRARSLSASLTVRDVPTSVKWYCDVLGFTKGKEYMFDGKLGAVSLKAGTIELLVNQDDGKQGFDRIKGVGLSLQLTTAQDVDAIAARAKAAGATLGMEPTTMPWGARIFRIMDPDGFRLVIST